MRLKFVPYILGAVMLAALTYGLARRAADPPHVVETGSIVLTDPSGARMVFARRVVAAGGVTTTEIQVPGLGWVDCRLDCKDALTQSRIRPWENVILK